MRPLKLDSVLVGSNLSDVEIPALRTAVALSRLAGAKLHIVHAVGDGDDDAAQKLDRHIRVADPGCEMLPGTTIRAGPADRVIVETAQMIGADVIVLGPHRSGHERSTGSTAYRVAARAERPCLVLPGEMRLPLGRILVPIDASGAARGALAVAMTWASALRRRSRPTSPDATRVVVLYVRTPADASDASTVLDDAMADVSDRVAVIAGVRVDRVAGTGTDAAAAILEHSEREEFDLMAVGTRARAIGPDLGSVSSALVKSATCPLLLVPPRVWRDQAAEPPP